MREELWAYGEGEIERDRARRVESSAWGRALRAGAQGEALKAALESAVEELCEAARASAREVEERNQSRDFAWLKEKRGEREQERGAEAEWVAAANESGRSAEALAALARQACERGLLAECAQALGAQFEKPGRLPCERVAQALLEAVAELSEGAAGGPSLMGAWADAERFWAAASWAEFGRPTRGLWGKKSPDSVFNGGVRESVGKPLARVLAAGMRDEAKAPDACRLARRVASLARGQTGEKEIWEELARGAAELFEEGAGPGAARVVSGLPLSYWLALRSWGWRRKGGSEASLALDEALIGSALDRAGQSEEEARALRTHLWLHLDKEGLSRWEARQDAGSVRDLEGWWEEELGAQLGSQAFVAAWARKLCSPGGAWARGAFAAAGLEAPENDEAAWGAWTAERLRADGLSALRGAYASLQAEWMMEGASVAARGPRAKRAL